MEEIENLNLLYKPLDEEIRRLLDNLFSELSSQGGYSEGNLLSIVESLQKYRTSNPNEYEKAIMGIGGSLILFRACCIKQPWRYQDSSPIWNLIKQETLHIVQSIIRTGTSVNQWDPQNSTPLHLAVRNSHIEIVKELIQAGADVNVQDEDGCTPFHRAGLFGRSMMIEKLIKECMGGNVREKYWRHSVAIRGDTKAVKLLIQARASLRIQDKFGCIPLHYAETKCGDRE